MGFFDIILWYFTLINFFLFCQKIRSKSLLQKCRTLVFFIGQNAFNGRLTPFFFSGRCRNFLFCQRFCNSINGLSAYKASVNEAYNLCFFRYDFMQSVLSFSVPKKMIVRQTDFSFCKASALSPCNIFGNGRLSSCAREDIIVISNSPLESSV